MTTRDIRRAGPRGWAIDALASLVVVVAGLVQVVAGSRERLLQLLVGTVLSAAVMAATAWWAFTTRRIWKRWLNIVLATSAPSPTPPPPAEPSAPRVGGCGQPAPPLPRPGYPPVQGLHNPAGRVPERPGTSACRGWW